MKTDIQEMNILVVEDESIIRNVVEAVLKDMGAKNISLANNGRKALTMIKEPIEPFDLIICDWMMPEMDGLELLKEVRVLGHKTIFLMLTAKSTQDAVVQVHKTGVDAYIVKPFTPAELKAKVGTLVRRAARPKLPPETAIAAVQKDNDRVRVTEWQFAPGASTGYHRRELDYVVIPISSGKLKMISPDGKESISTLIAGMSYYQQGGVEHDVVNVNKFDFTFVEVELK